MPDVRTNFHQPVCVTADEFEWVPSPQAGVQRVLLDRVGDEKAVATSLVHYAPGSHYPCHDHSRGEEIVVVEGVFIDEFGRYPAGSYLRNPPLSRHSPYSDVGCVLFVKLCQFHPDDRESLVTDVNVELPTHGSTHKKLHQFQGETASAVAIAKGASVEWAAQPLIQEVFILEGRVHWNGQSLEARSWLRIPENTGLYLSAATPSRLLHKTRPAFGIPGAEGSGCSIPAQAQR